MENEIIDQLEIRNSKRKADLCKLFLWPFIMVVLLVIVQFLSPYYPYYLIKYNSITITWSGSLSLIIIIICILKITSSLNKLDNKMSLIKVILFTGLIIFISELIFKFIQGLMYNSFKDINHIEIIKASLIFGFISMLISNIKIHKIRKKKLYNPILILIFVWILTSIVIQINRVL